MEIFHSAPESSSFTPLQEHQSRTPESFYSGPPVLYHFSAAARLRVRESSLQASPPLLKLVESAVRETGDGNHASDGLTNGHGEEGLDEDKETTVDGVDIWVTSEKFLLWRHASSVGLAIPYPSISLHAISSEGLYLQLVTTTTPFDDHDPTISAELTLIPTSTCAPAAPAATTPASAEAPADAPSTNTTNPVSALFDAVSACANLHPDPVDDEEADEDNMLEDENAGPYAVLGTGATGMPPPMPGSGGWITADNVGEFFDEEGNWRQNNSGGVNTEGTGLGEGAGVVREREEEMDGDGQRVDGVGDGEETKWRRTE